METLTLDIERIKSPSPKVLMMYQAVSELIRGKMDIRSITVSDITKKAGIGKGTAYEYFSSKEELLASALVHEYGSKLKNLAATVQQPGDFFVRCGKIMDWLVDNREYNIMFSHILQSGMEGQSGCDTICEQVPEELFAGIHTFLDTQIDKFMQSGYEAGVFTEQHVGKRRLAFVSAMMQYAMVVMEPKKREYIELPDEELREFIYQGMIKALS